MDYKEEWYLKRNKELTKALLKIKKFTLDEKLTAYQTVIKINDLIEKLNISSSVVKG